MIEDAWLQWALTLVFGATALHSVGLTAASRTAGEGTGHMLHLVMSLDMAAMCWPFWSSIPALPQTIFFAASAAWFAGRFAGTLRRGRALAHTALHQVSHLAMMLGMLWMVVAMGDMAEPQSAASSATASGMASSGTAAMSMHHSMLGPIASVSGSVLVALLIASGVLFCLETVRVRARRRWHASANAAMSLGMVVMCWPMLAS